MKINLSWNHNKAILKDIKKRFPSFTRTERGIVSLQKERRNNSEKKISWPGPDIVRKLCG